MLEIKTLTSVISNTTQREWKHQQSIDITSQKSFIRYWAILWKDTEWQ